MVGLIPLFAVRVLDGRDLENLPNFVARTDWFLANRPDLAKRMAVMVDRNSTMGDKSKASQCRLMALPSHDRLLRILSRMFDVDEFFSPYGIRSLSKVHETPYVLKLGETEYSITYQAEESDTSMFGGNSNWRGPVWFPVNYLLIESLKKYHVFCKSRFLSLGAHFVQLLLHHPFVQLLLHPFLQTLTSHITCVHVDGDDFKIQVPSHSGEWMNLSQAADEISARLQRLFIPDPKTGKVPCHASESRFNKGDPLFYEYVA
jgi:hypothetical protein